MTLAYGSFSAREGGTYVLVISHLHVLFKRALYKCRPVHVNILKPKKMMKIIFKMNGDCPRTAVAIHYGCRVRVPTRSVFRNNFNLVGVSVQFSSRTSLLGR